MRMTPIRKSAKRRKLIENEVALLRISANRLVSTFYTFDAVVFSSPALRVCLNCRVIYGYDPQKLYTMVK